MWSDNESSVDLLRFEYLVKAVTRLVRDPALRPVTIGVYGDWGSGKSTVMQLAQKELERDEKTIVLAFNGWLFKDFEDAKTALMGTILDALQTELEKNKSLYEKVKDRLAGLLRRVDILHVAGMAIRYGAPMLLGMPQLGLASAAKDAADVAMDRAKEFDPGDMRAIMKEATPREIRRDIREFRAEFTKLLEEAGIGSLVVFIDDLDRCLPDTIIETLEAIKLFLFVPRTAFVIGADERLIQYAVRKNFPELPGTETEVGRDYLEKLVQIPVRVPPLGGSEVESYMNLLFAQKHVDETRFKTICADVAAFRSTDTTAVAFSAAKCRELITPPLAALEEGLDLTSQTAAVLAPGLSGSPRRTKRFLNALLLRMEMSADRGLTLQRKVLAKLMLVEYIKPIFFRQLARLQAEQDGKPRELAIAEAAASTGRAAEDEKPKGKTRAAQLPAPDAAQTVPEVQPWLADTWMHTWLASEPSLGETDLRSYFYIAHDEVGRFDATRAQLSPVARDALASLLDEGEPTQEQGLKLAATLNAADTTAVFEALTHRVRGAEGEPARMLQTVLLKLVERRRDLIPQLVAFLGELPEPRIAAATPMAFVGIVRGDTIEASGAALLDRWSKSATPKLVVAAKKAAERLTPKA